MSTFRVSEPTTKLHKFYALTIHQYAILKSVEIALKTPDNSSGSS
jgi:hypothetical protein